MKGKKRKQEEESESDFKPSKGRVRRHKRPCVEFKERQKRVNDDKMEGEPGSSGAVEDKGKSEVQSDKKREETRQLQDPDTGDVWIQGTAAPWLKCQYKPCQMEGGEPVYEGMPQNIPKGMATLTQKKKSLNQKTRGKQQEGHV